jgi:hypothetical protein
MRIFHLITCAALIAFLTGCEEEERYQLRFSHNLHVTENGMGCEDCHGAPGQPDFKAITHATCLDCHDEPEAEEISAETCGICHQAKQVALYEAASKLPEGEAAETEEMKAGDEEPDQVADEQAAVSSKSVFVHTEALAGKCADCHSYLLDAELVSVPELAHDDIVSIRNQAHRSGQECSTCHVDMDPAIAPGSHDIAWTKRHGQFAMQPDASCSVCHTQDSCADCHSVMQPASHNNMFRMKTHGTMAAWNRASCQVCHTEDSCTSCHATTRPKSHNARWGAPGFKPTHCIGCHNTSSPGDGCVTCHEGGNDVMLHARYWGNAPINHNQPGIQNCYICHWTHTP